MNWLLLIGVVIGLFVAFAIGSWFEQGGKSKDEDYDDD